MSAAAAARMRKEADPQWQYLYSVTREFLRRWTVAFTMSTNLLQGEAAANNLEAAVANGNPAPVLQALPWTEFGDELQARWTPLLESVMARAGAAEMRRLNLPLRFDIRNPFAERWIQRHAAELVVEVTDETKRAIRAVVLQGFENGNPPRRMAMRIREMVGLTTRDALAVQRRWHTLFEESALPVSQIDGMTDAYARKLHRRRAENISRTETVRASAEGVSSSWQEAVSQGLLPPESKRVWIASMTSGRTCEICLELGDHAPVGLDEPFFSSVLGRNVMIPPAHPSCRCTPGLVAEVPKPAPLG